MIFTYSYDFFFLKFGIWLCCKRVNTEKPAITIQKSTNRKQKSRQFNGLVQVSTERHSMTLKLNLLNHKTITY